MSGKMKEERDAWKKKEGGNSTSSSSTGRNWESARAQERKSIRTSSREGEGVGTPATKRTQFVAFRRKKKKGAFHLADCHGT